MTSLHQFLRQLKESLELINTFLPAIRRDLEEIVIHAVLLLIFGLGIWKLIEALLRARE